MVKALRSTYLDGCIGQGGRTFIVSMQCLFLRKLVEHGGIEWVGSRVILWSRAKAYERMLRMITHLSAPRVREYPEAEALALTA